MKKAKVPMVAISFSGWRGRWTPTVAATRLYLMGLWTPFVIIRYHPPPPESSEYPNYIKRKEREK